MVIFYSNVKIVIKATQCIDTNEFSNANIINANWQKWKKFLSINCRPFDGQNKNLTYGGLFFSLLFKCIKTKNSVRNQ